VTATLSRRGQQSVTPPGEPTRWPLRAACGGADPEVFYPRNGGRDARDWEQARAICADCPVRAECLADAIACRDDQFGMRAGLTPAQRRPLTGGGRRSATSGPRRRRGCA
jgi:WhiB family redox-sensing transcriptional regulator